MAIVSDSESILFVYANVADCITIQTIDHEGGASDAVVVDVADVGKLCAALRRVAREIRERDDA
jgi:hypothetical protein